MRVLVAVAAAVFVGVQVRVVVGGLPVVVATGVAPTPVTRMALILAELTTGTNSIVAWPSLTGPVKTRS